MTRQRPHLDGLDKKQIAWLDSRLCGWCEIRLTASSCGSYHHLDKSRCDMKAKRASALLDYKPREPKAPNPPVDDTDKLG